MIELRFAVYSLPQLLKLKITKIIHVCKPDTAKAPPPPPPPLFSFSSFFTFVTFLLELCTVAKLKIEKKCGIINQVLRSHSNSLGRSFRGMWWIFPVFFYCMYSIWNGWSCIIVIYVLPKVPFLLVLLCTSIYELPFLAFIAFGLELTNKWNASWVILLVLTVMVNLFCVSVSQTSVCVCVCVRGLLMLKTCRNYPDMFHSWVYYSSCNCVTILQVMTVCLKSFGNQQLRKAKIQMGYKQQMSKRKAWNQTGENKKKNKKMTARTQKERKGGKMLGLKL